MRLDQLPPQARAQIEAKLAQNSRKTAEKRPKTRKYRNQPCEANGERYRSKLELAVHQALVERYGREAVMREVSVPIGARVECKRGGQDRMVVDFVVVVGMSCGRPVTQWLDAKGRVTPAWRQKAARLLDRHGIRVVVVRSPAEALEACE